MRQATPLSRPSVVPQSVGLCQLLRAPAATWPFPTFSLPSFPYVLGPLPRRLVGCPCPFLPTRHRPSPREERVGAPRSPLQRLQEGRPLRGCSHSLMFRPVGLLTTPIAPTAAAHTVGQPWFLRPSLSQVVASPRLGYANRPNRAIDGIGTFTLSDMQPCRLLPLRRA